MKSILQKEKECWFCKTTYNLQEHHIYFGSANRKISEKNGFKVWLCMYHHTGDIRGNKESVHHNKDMAEELKILCQAKYEETHTREDFMSLIGENYL